LKNINIDSIPLFKCGTVPPTSLKPSYYSTKTKTHPHQYFLNKINNAGVYIWDIYVGCVWGVYINLPPGFLKISYFFSNAVMFSIK
jgi:hypothetical protein